MKCWVPSDFCVRVGAFRRTFGRVGSFGVVLVAKVGSETR